MGVTGLRPFFEKKVKLLKKLIKSGYSKKFILHRVAYENFPGILGLPEGHNRPTPIFGKN